MKTLEKTKNPYGEYLGSGKEVSNRKEFGKIVADILLKMDPEVRKKTVKVIDCDLLTSNGLVAIAKKVPECFVYGGQYSFSSYR